MPSSRKWLPTLCGVITSVPQFGLTYTTNAYEAVPRGMAVHLRHARIAGPCLAVVINALCHCAIHSNTLRIILALATGDTLAYATDTRQSTIIIVTVGIIRARCTGGVPSAFSFVASNVRLGIAPPIWRSRLAVRHRAARLADCLSRRPANWTLSIIPFPSL